MSAALCAGGVASESGQAWSWAVPSDAAHGRSNQWRADRVKQITRIMSDRDSRQPWTRASRRGSVPFERSARRLRRRWRFGISSNVWKMRRLRRRMRVDPRGGDVHLRRGDAIAPPRARGVTCESSTRRFIRSGSTRCPGSRPMLRREGRLSHRTTSRRICGDRTGGILGQLR